MAGQRRLRAVGGAKARDGAPDLRDAVANAIKGMSWLKESDKALTALALRTAEEIEKVVDRADELGELQREAAGDQDLYKRLKKLEAHCDVTKTVGWLGPQLQGLLRDLGGTPAARRAMKADQPVGGRLAQIRREAGEHDS